MVEIWERHTAAEFEAKSIEATMATMTADPVVNHVPVMDPPRCRSHRAAFERFYWDQASVLLQVGMLDAEYLPVTGIEASRKVIDPAREPSNALIERAIRSRG